MIPILGLALGIIVGLVIDAKTDFYFSSVYSSYIAVAILASLDSIFGGISAILQKHFNNLIFVTGFFGNAILAAGLAYLGDKLGMPIYLAAVIVFGGRLFQNFAIIRRYFIDSLSKKKDKKEESVE